MMRDEISHNTVDKSTEIVTQFITKDIGTIPYLVLLFAAAIVVIALLIISALIYLIKRRRKNRQCGIKLKQLFLKDSKQSAFFAIYREKFKQNEDGYVTLEAKAPNALFKQSDASARGMTCGRKGILVSFISFRVFYALMFTSSVALSILLSFWPLDGVDNLNTASVWTRKVIASSGQRKIVSYESDVERSLNQNSAKAAHLVYACEDLLIRQMLDIAREFDRTVQEVLDIQLNPQKSHENMLSTVETFVLRQMSDLNLGLQDYIIHLRAELNNSMTVDVGQFSKLLSSIYNSQWLLFVKRMLNGTSTPGDVKQSDAHFVHSPQHLNALRLKISNIEFARRFGLAEAENYLFIPALIMSQLEHLVLSRVASVALQPNFVSDIYRQDEPNAQNGLDQSSANDQTTFKPLILRLFTTVDDATDINHEQESKPYLDVFSSSGPPSKKRPLSRIVSWHLIPLSLGQLRFTLLLIDCYLIAARFYDSYTTLRKILIGQRLVVDAASYLKSIQKMPTQRQNERESLKSSMNSAYHEEKHYRCEHTAVIQPQTDYYACGYHQRQQQRSTTLIRPIKSVQDIGGSSISSLRMTFTRTNQFIVIIFGCAAVLFLSVFAISVNRRFLRPSISIFLVDTDSSNKKINDDKYAYMQSEELILNHADYLNNVVLSLARLNENRLRKRMQRITERFRHDLRNMEHQFRAENCEIARLLDRQGSAGGPTTSASYAPASSICSPTPMRMVKLENLFRQELCPFLPFKPSSLPQFPDLSIKQQKQHMTKTGPFVYLWGALTSWIGDSSFASPLAVSHLLVIALCIMVVMFGLIIISQFAGSLCHLLHQGQLNLNDCSIHLLSAVAPPLERKFGPSSSSVFSVLKNKPNFPFTSPHGNKIVQAATPVNNDTIPNDPQYRLFSNPPQYPKATVVLSTEQFTPHCTQSFEQTEV